VNGEARITAAKASAAFASLDGDRFQELITRRPLASELAVAGAVTPAPAGC
jgi:hypothetical protein